jgi:multimeric flavodoxin WrbA
MSGIIILGSSRSEGNTAEAASRLRKSSNWDMINLNDHEIGYYDYNHSHADDDFIPLMRKIIENYDSMIFATPVYWYSMSGIMKVFFDRLTDLLEIEKDLGRKLRGKNMAVLSCSIGDNLGESFWLPFSSTAKYLGMNYVGNVHVLNDENGLMSNEHKKIKEFADDINDAIQPRL